MSKAPIEDVLRDLAFDCYKLGRDKQYPPMVNDHISTALTAIKGMMPKPCKTYAIEGEPPLSERGIGHNLCLYEVNKNLFGEQE